MGIELPREALQCSGCGRAEVFRQGDKRRTWRRVPLGGKPVFLELAVPRVWCFRCQTNRQVRVTFADEKVRHTRAFERYAWDLSRSMTIRDVTRHLGVSWDTIKDIQKRFLVQHFARPQLKSLEQIAIDEIAIGKGHRYVTLVLDLKSGAVVFVGNGKGTDALEPFWNGCGRREPRCRPWPPISRRRTPWPCAGTCPTPCWSTTGFTWSHSCTITWRSCVENCTPKPQGRCRRRCSRGRAGCC